MLVSSRIPRKNLLCPLPDQTSPRLHLEFLFPFITPILWETQAATAQHNHPGGSSRKSKRGNLCLSSVYPSSFSVTHSPRLVDLYPAPCRVPPRAGRSITSRLFNIASGNLLLGPSLLLPNDLITRHCITTSYSFYQSF